jgi:hypothetical protein
MESVSTDIDSLLTHMTEKYGQKLEIKDITNVQLIAGGSVEQHLDLFQTGLSMMNNENKNIEDLMMKFSSTHLLKYLKKNIKLLPQMTYLLPDEEEDKGQ